MKTRAEVDELKCQWQADPIWDIYKTEGFEDYRLELQRFQRDCESQWEQESLRRKFQRAEALGIPGNFALLDLIENLEYQIEQLRQRVSQIEGA